MQVRYEDFRDNMPPPPICERLFIHSPAFRDGDGGGGQAAITIAEQATGAPNDSEAALVMP